MSDQQGGEDLGHDHGSLSRPPSHALPDVADVPLLELLQGSDPRIHAEIRRLSALLGNTVDTTTGWQSFLDPE